MSRTSDEHLAFSYASVQKDFFAQNLGKRLKPEDAEWKSNVEWKLEFCVVSVC